MKSGSAIPYRLLEENVLNNRDYRILWGLCQGKSYKEIASYVKVSEKVVNDRINFLEHTKILLKRAFPLIDITRIWNHVYMAQVKLQLATPLSIPGYPAPPAWKEIIKKFESLDPRRFENLVRFAFVPFGTEYDVILLITAQSLAEYVEFFSDLRKSSNVERIWGTEAIPLAGTYFNPVSIPSPEEIEASVNEMLSSRFVRNLRTQDSNRRSSNL